MRFYVYKVTNLLDGKFYIGVHKQKDGGTDEYFGSGRRIVSAIKRYGKQNFKKEVLQEFESLTEAFDHEKIILTPKVLESDSCYNLNIGGFGGSKSGHIKNFGKISLPRSIEYRNKISRTLKGRSTLTPEGRIKKSEKLKGNQHAKGNTYSHTDEAKRKIGNAHRGKILSSSTREKISKSNSGRLTGDKNPMSNPLSRKKVSNSKIGMKLLIGPNGERRLAKPLSQRWIELLSLDFMVG